MPKTVLRLQAWLQEFAGSNVTGISSSLESDTVLQITVKQEIPLAQMLAEQADVEVVTVEVVTEERDSEEPETVRLRVVLKAD